MPVRLDIEEGCPVKAIQSPHENDGSLDADKLHDLSADRIWPNRSPQAEGAADGAVIATALPNEIPSRLMKPIQHFELVELGEPGKPRTPRLEDFDATNRAIQSTSTRTCLAIRPRCRDAADEINTRIERAR